MAPTSLSVIIPSYGRPAQVEQLLADLAAQSLPAERFEVIVVDDGSPEPLAPRLEPARWPFALSVLRQHNAGASAARQAGIARATGSVVLFLDDDMRAGPSLLFEHLLAHERAPRAAVQGRISSPPDLAARPPFERYHQQRLEAWFAQLALGHVKLRGANLCSGNLSVRRSALLEVGGFDPSLARSEDAELGLRLERAGVELRYADGAAASHCSGPESSSQWLAGALRYGSTELAVSRKHPWAAHADPFRYLFALGAPRGALLAACALSPRSTAQLPRALVAAGDVLDAAHLRGAAVQLAGLAYATQVYRGLGEALGSPRAVAGACQRFLARVSRDPRSVDHVPRALSAAARAAEDFHEDVAARQRGEAKYALPHAPRAAPALVENIGLQIVLGIRAMHFFTDAGAPLGARIVSRLMRHLYCCDVHWGAQIAPGFVIAHGMGVAIGDGVKIGPGCIITHNVSLGAGKDAQSGARGVPVLEEDVHLSPGTVILGPITLGAGTKVLPGAVVTASVPPRSIVEMPPPLIHLRSPPLAPAALLAAAAH